MKKQVKKFFEVFKLSVLKRQARDLGASITWKNLAIVLLAIIMGVFIIGSLLKLQLAYMLIAVLFLLMCTPHIMLLTFRGNYEKYRFKDIVSYMEQIIYAFHKNGKINDALVDTYKTCEGSVKGVIEEMIDVINGRTMTSNPYAKAFAVMEEKYKCTRLKLLHNFLMECEETGGENAEALQMLINDIRSWSERTLEYQAQRRKARNDVILSIFLALFTCGLMINVIPEDYTIGMVAQPLYQIVTLFCVLASVVIYIVVQTKVSKSYLDIEMDGDSSDYAIRKREFLKRYDSKDHTKPMIIKICLMLMFVIIEVVLRLSYLVIIPTAIVALIVLIFDGIRRNSAISVITKELYLMFPQWIRTLSLCLQTDNVHVSIQKSLRDCPRVLKPDVEMLCERLFDDPVSAKPYNAFLAEYNVPTLRLSVNYLYLASQFGTDDTLAQLDYLVAQTTQLTIQEEKIRNEAALAGINMFIFAPMLVAIIKLMVDLSMFIAQFMGLLANYV